MKRTILAMLLATELVGADPIVHLTPAERAQPNNPRTLLALTEEATAPLEIARLARACQAAYRSPDAEYKAVTRSLLAHPNSLVRENAVFMAQLCIQGGQPDRTFFPLIKSVYEAETRDLARANILHVVGTCTAPDPAVTELLQNGLRAREAAVVAMALSTLSLRAPDRSNAALIKALRQRPEAEVRAWVFDAIVQQTPEDARRTALTPLFREGLKDTDGAVVARVLQGIEKSHATELLPVVCTLIEDPRATRLIPEASKKIVGDLPGPVTPVQHYALRCMHALSTDLVGSAGYPYPYWNLVESQITMPLAPEVVKARKWMSAHRDLLLKGVQP